MERVERGIEIDAPVESVFEMFSDFESFPRWMRRVREVRRTGKRTTRWRAGTALGIDVTWNAETTVYEPDHRIVWRSVDGDVKTDAEAIFEETPRDTTLLRVVLGYATPSGRSGAEAARFFGKLPGQQLEEDLERFRRIAERHGDVRRREALPTTRREWPRPPKEMRVEERARERRFDEALREARRSQIENERRYREEREIEERRYALTPRERERKRGVDERQTNASGASERMLRRGVDRLLDDEAPSRFFKRRERDRDK